MRVTNSMLAGNFLRDMRSNLQNMRTLQNQLTSGKEIRKPSDDPFKVARAMQLHSDIDSNKQYNENIKDTINWLDTTDSALNQAGNVLQRVRELIVASGNAGYGSSERKAIKDEINEKIGEFSQIMNTNFDGKYVFAGTRGAFKPVDVIKDASGNSQLQYVGRDGEVIADGRPLLNTDGSIALNDTLKSMLGYAPSTDADKLFIDEKGSLVKGKSVPATIVADKDGTITSDIQIGNLDIKANTATTIPSTNLNNLMKQIVDFSSSKPSGNIALSPELKQILGDAKVTSQKDATGNITTIEIEDKNGGKLTIDAAGDITSPTTPPIKIGNLTIDSATSGSVDSKWLMKKISDPINQFKNLGTKVETEISQGVTMEYNVTATEIFSVKDKKGNEKNLMDIFKNIVDKLGSDKATDINDLTSGGLQDITDAMDNILKIRSTVGAKQNRMDSAKDKNEEENFNMTDILSKTEDIDMTEKVMEYSTMQTVYTASLQTSAKVLQPSLLDYLR